jgi:cytochrome c553
VTGRLAAVAGLAALLVSAGAPAQQAARPAAAAACGACHGANGIAVAPDAPHLAGQPAIYLAAQLRAYRSGARRHEQMNVVAKPLADGDIDALAAWFAAIRIEAKEPAR